MGGASLTSSGLEDCPPPYFDMVHRRLRPLVLLAALALALPAGDAAAARRHVPPGFLGVNLNGPMLDPGVSAPNELAAMTRAGVESVRLPVFWAPMQPSQDGPIDFSVSDRLIGAAAARGMRVLPTVLRAPDWAELVPGTPYNASPPRDPATYAAFLTALVHRYGPGGDYWRAHPRTRAVPVRAYQIWNEPGQTYYWTDQPFAPGYVRLLAAARTAIKAADGGAKVVLAGLNSGLGYLSWTDLGKVYAAGGGQLFDEAAQNPFSLRAANVVRSVRLFRGVMARHGDRRKPLLLTELSWPSAKGMTTTRYGFEVSEGDQAKRIREAIPLLSGLRTQLHLGGIYWYTWLSPPLGSDQPFDYSGLRRQSGARIVSKPALAAWRSTARSLEGCAKSTSATRCG
jgi:polysaccharide biosynthesis protein PslG